MAEYRFMVKHIIRGGKYSGPLVPEIFYAGRMKKGKEEKGGKKEKKEKERKKKEEKKKNRKKERKKIERKRVTVPINSHFVQGQTLGVGGAAKIIYERTLIAECSLVCRQPCSTPFGPLLALYHTTALVPKFAIHIVPLRP